MTNFSQKQPQSSPATQKEASNFTLGVVMAGIAAFFIAGIASAFIYAKDTDPLLSAKAPAATAPAETTGSGGGK
jgi:hypothetical protein